MIRPGHTIRLIISERRYTKLVEVARRRGCPAEQWVRETLENAVVDANAPEKPMPEEHYTMSGGDPWENWR